MSTILKALKKLEERKASEGQRDGDIAWDILREQGRENERQLPWRLWLAGLAFFLVLVSVTLWFTYRPFQKPDQRLTTVPEATSVEHPTAPEKIPQELPPATSPPPTRPVVVPSPSIALSPVPADLNLSVSGIAFQEASEASMAIVNDLPVMVGTVIEGVVVEQIEEQRVIFSLNDRRFAIPLTTSD